MRQVRLRAAFTRAAHCSNQDDLSGTEHRVGRQASRTTARRIGENPQAAYVPATGRTTWDCALQIPVTNSRHARPGLIPHRAEPGAAPSTNTVEFRLSIRLPSGSSHRVDSGHGTAPTPCCKARRRLSELVVSGITGTAMASDLLHGSSGNNEACAQELAESRCGCPPTRSLHALEATDRLPMR